VTVARTPSQLGAANRRKGATAERAVASYLRFHGFPHAERAVRTGFRTACREGVDPGALTGTPGICWQITDRDDLAQDAVLSRRMAETADQAAAAKADLGLLVQRRRGHADPGRWWCWMQALDLRELWGPPLDVVTPQWNRPVRMELGDVVAHLRAAGYGEPEVGA
jgi:hypothetical protein